jgi:hypothetical protein
MPYVIETHDKPDHYWLGLQERPAHLDSLRMAYLYRKCYL